MMVATVPCDMLPEDGRFTFGRGEECAPQGCQNQNDAKEGSGDKRPRLMSLSEREIVGPGYSAEPEVMTLVPGPQGDESHHG
jgi:hypothetical protein